MPFYRYEHEGAACDLGTEFEWVQSIKDDKLTACPQCQAPIARLIPRSIQVVAAKTNKDLRNMGFTKLVRRDKGVYENVTGGEGPKIVDANE